MPKCKECMNVNRKGCPYYASPEDERPDCKKFKKWEKDSYKVIYMGDFPIASLKKKDYIVRFSIFSWKGMLPKAKFNFVITTEEGRTYSYKNKFPVQLPAREVIKLFESIVDEVKSNPKLVEAMNTGETDYGKETANEKRAERKGKGRR